VFIVLLLAPAGLRSASCLFVLRETDAARMRAVCCIDVHP
jgi:hypothetical protein